MASFATSSSKPAVPPGTGSGGTGYSRSPDTRSGTRLVASTRSARRRSEKREIGRDAASICSRLSSTSRSERSRRSANASPAVSELERMRDRGQHERRPFDDRGEIDEAAPSRSSRPSASATASASRVLPGPAGAGQCQSRTSSRRSSASTAAISSRRPTSDVAARGSRWLPGGSAVGASRSSSWRRIARSSSWSAGPGSTPSSSTSDAPGRAIRVERLLLPARAVERKDLLLAQPLAEGVLRATSASSSGERAARARRARAARRSGARPREPELLEPRHGAPRDRLVGEIGERRALPERRGRREVLCRLGGRARRREPARPRRRAARSESRSSSSGSRRTR